MVLLAALVADAQSNLVLFVSASGDYIGQGHIYVTDNPDEIGVSSAPPYFNASKPPAVITVSAFGYSFTFSAPDSNINSLSSGAYPNAVRYPFNGSAPGLDVSGDGRGCNTECGSFQINELGINESNQVDRLWLTFSNSCDCSMAPMTGEIRYNSQLAPPIIIITQQPTNQLIYSGNTAVVDVAATGLEPMFFNWYLNGTNVAVTTNGQLVISDFQTGEAGTYEVEVTNEYCSATFSNFVLAVTDAAPMILSQPAGALERVGSDVVLAVHAAGSQPIFYQWRFNGESIDAGTNLTLLLPDIPFAAEGSYDVVVSNVFGVVISTGAYLRVMDFAEALNTPSMTWTTGGDVPWEIETNATHDGYAAAQSGALSIGQQSILQTTVTGPGKLTYWWNIDSYAGSGINYLTFSANDVGQSRISFMTGWLLATNYLGVGEQNLKWTYSQPIDTPARHLGYLDQVSFIPGATAAFISLQPTNRAVLVGSNVTMVGVAAGTPPLIYQWQMNGTNIIWATNATLTLTNVQLASQGSYRLLVTNAYGSTYSAMATLTVADFNGAANTTNLLWGTDGNKPWFPETSVTHDGLAALQSGVIGGNQQSATLTTIEGPGTLSFWWKVYCETNNDFVTFTLDGGELARNSGLLNQWQKKTFYLGSGAHALAWTYSKNATLNYGSDAAWLDEVAFTPGVTAAFIAAAPSDLVVPISSNAVFSVVAGGTPPLSYQWYYNGMALLSATNSALNINNVQLADTGAYSVSVSNAYGGAFSTNVQLSVLDVYAWGAGSNNVFQPVLNSFQSLVPTNLTGVKAIAAGGYHSLALLENGRVVAWGNNMYGQTNLQSAATNVSAITAGLFHNLVLRSNGTAIAWGSTPYGLTSIPIAATNLSAVSAGWYHNLALRSDGTVVAWGAGTYVSYAPYYGQCMVPTNLTDVRAIAAGGYHSLALRADGTVVAWGWNAFGQTNVPAGLSQVIAIAAGGSNSIALKRDGTLVAWGANAYGQTNIPEGLTNAIAISAGTGHNLALKSDGTMVAWGLNGNGQTNTPAGASHVMAISAGGYHSLALINAGPVAFLVQPVSASIYEGEDARFNVSCLGQEPLTYQWLKDGTNLSGFTSPALGITNAEFLDAGNYQVVVSNSFGVATSSVGMLNVLDRAPFIVSQPTNTVVLQDAIAKLSAVVSGVSPLYYQWLFNGAALAGETNSTLVISNAQLTSQGYYALVVTNVAGSLQSSNAYLDVVDLAEALGWTNAIWFSLGSPAWGVQSTNTHDGFAAVGVAPLGSGDYPVLQTSIAGPGTLTFWWASQQYASLAFQLDGDTKATFSSYNPVWSPRTFYLGAGIHILNWTATGSYSSPYKSGGFLDDVSFVPGGTAVAIVTQPASQTNLAGNNITFSVGSIGTPPITYQWYFNGTAIPGATGASLTLNNLQETNAGNYYVMLDNGYGTAMSSNALLAVTPTPPIITTQPVGGLALAGSTFVFTGRATGSGQVRYQWLFNGSAIAGATNATLALTNVQIAHGGEYSFYASNFVGVVTSSVAVLAPYSIADIGVTLDSPDFTWSTTNVPWFPQTNTTHDGLSAAQSGVIADVQQSTLQGVVTGPATVTYWWKVNCDDFWVNLAFVQNGSIQNAIGGNVDWVQATNYIGAGTNVLEWKLYPLHNAFAGGTGWVDQVEIIPGGTPASITSQPTGSTNLAGTSMTLSVAATGTPPLIYQWQFNGEALPGATNASLALNNLQAVSAGDYYVTVTNEFGSVASSNVILVVNPASPAISRQPAAQVAVAHSSTSFSVVAWGSNPLDYQWYFGASLIPGATNATLILTNLSMSDMGYYWVTISNGLGGVVSANAYLDVAPMRVVDFWAGRPGQYAAPAGLGYLYDVAAGKQHTLALRQDGLVAAWGDNAFGQTNVPPGLSNVVAIAAGNYHSLALKAGGTVQAWGDNTYGESVVPAGLSNVISIAAGPLYNLALKSDGTVVGWGDDTYGQIDVPLDLTNAVVIGAGPYAGLATLKDGTIRQWGNNPVWQHNYTNTTLLVGGDLTNAVAACAGAFTGWGMRSDGSVVGYGWYDNVGSYFNSYSIGSSSGYASGYSPVRVEYGGIVDIAAGGGTTPYYDYALLLDEKGYITQAGTQGNLFIGSGISVPFISLPQGSYWGISPSNVIAIAAGAGHAAAIIGDGSPRVVRNPLNRIAYAGDTVMFNAGIVAPFGVFQWQLNGTDLDGATNAWLVLTNVPLTASGAYRCLAANHYGAVTNVEATLTVLRSTPSFNLTGAGLATDGGFSWRLDRLSGHGNIIVFASTNLLDWTPIFTNPPHFGTMLIIDQEANRRSERFYRVLEE